jgi:Response regulators consisting of a CheY-like receiver domain and a winged-helix DNA-binding domain
MTKILIVEDEIPMLQGLKDNLELEGYIVDAASDGKEGLEKIRSGNFNLILLDVMLPGISGFEICKTIRKENNLTPVILLTAKGEEIDKVLGLELGADDYITKPFSLRELLARIKTILRRTSGGSANSESSTVISIGRLKINFANYEAFTDEVEVKMSHKEFELIKYLWNHKNLVIARNELMDNVWGIESDVTTRTVDNFIVKLRQKIEVNPNEPKIILTVHGIGYKMIG